MRFAKPRGEWFSGERKTMSDDSTVLPARRRIPRAYRWCALLGVCLAAGSGAAVVLSHTPVYKAECWLEIAPTFIVFAEEGKGNDRAFARTQQELIKSPPAMTDVLAKPEIASLPIFEGVVDPVAFLRKRIQASPQRGTNVYTISLQSDNRESVAPIVNAVLEAYLALINTRQTTQDQALLALLKSEQRRKQTEIETLQERVKALARQIATINGPRPEALAEALNRLEVELVISEAELMVAKAKSTAEQFEPTLEAIRQRLESDANFAELQARFGELHARLDDPEIAQRRRDATRLEFEVAEKQLGEMRTKLEPETRVLLIEEHELRKRREIAALEVTFDARRQVVNELAARLTESRVSDAGSDSSLEFEFMAQDLQREKAVEKRIAERIQTIETEARRLGDVTVLSNAATPQASVNPFAGRNLALASAAGFAAPFLFLGLWSAGGSLFAFPRRTVRDDAT